MARITGFIASSLDGFIADANERLDWLDTYGSIDYGDYGYDAFIANVGTVVMGRGTYDWLRNEVEEWVYPGYDSIVVTSHPLPDPPARVTVWTESIDALVSHLRALPDKDAWIAGGGKLQSAFLERNAMDHFQIFVMPVLIGSGIPLWPGAEAQTPLHLEDARHLDGGVVRLAYTRVPD